jgi:isocitrate dehydrogenase (NAD+)
LATPAAGPREVVLLQAGPVSDALGDAVKQCVAALGVPITWREVDAGVRAVQQGERPMPDRTVQAIREAGVALKPLLRTPVGTGYVSPNVRLRQELGVYAGVRPLRPLRGLPSRYQGFDVLLVREMTEGTYAGIEHEIVPGVVQSIKVTTRQKCEQVCEYAFQLAKRRGRKQVCIVHKANILKASDGMLVAIGKEVASRYPEIGVRDIIVDNCAMQLVARPEQFDVLVADSMYGDILGDVGAGLIGSALAVPSINVAPDAHVFEATWHVPVEAAQGPEVTANPLALLVPAMEMLRYLGYGDAADRLRAAVEHVLIEGAVKTPDLGGRASTFAMTTSIIAALERVSVHAATDLSPAPQAATATPV